MVLDCVRTRMACKTTERGRHLRCLLVVLVLLMAVAVSAAPSFAAGVTAEEILKRMATVYSSAGSVWLKMQVSIMNPEAGESLGFVASVSVDIESELLRLEIVDTDMPMMKGQTVVVDGKEKAIYIYMPVLNQVMIQPMADAANAGAGGMTGGVGGLGAVVPTVPGLGLEGAADIDELANAARLLGIETFQGRRCYVVDVRSEEKDEDGREVVVTGRFWVAADDYMMLKFETLDESGTPVMSTTVLDYKVNPGFTREKLLTFPKGVPVVDMRKKK